MSDELHEEHHEVSDTTSDTIEYATKGIGPRQLINAVFLLFLVIRNLYALAKVPSTPPVPDIPTIPTITSNFTEEIEYFTFEEIEANITSIQESDNNSFPELTSDELIKFYRSPKDYIGRKIKMDGFILSEPIYKEEGVILQVMKISLGAQSKCLLYYSDPSIKFSEFNSIIFYGSICGTTNSINANGEVFVVPVISCTQITNLTENAEE